MASSSSPPSKHPHCDGHNNSGDDDEPKQQQDKSSTSSSTCGVVHSSAVIIFSAPLVRKLNEARLPPNYVGVRRIRPSSLGVKAKLQEGQATTKKFKSQVVFRVATADGQDRRMTRQEKKQVKYQIALEKKKRKHESLEANEGEGEGERGDDDGDDDDEVKGDVEEALPPKFLLTARQNGNDESSSKYHQLGLNAAALEQEIADLRGERGAVPPVFLSPAMAVQAQGIILPEISSLMSSDNSFVVRYDHELSLRWAKEIKESMIPAETTRQGEDMRPMAYQLMPEIWSRMRPDWQKTETISDTRIHESIFSTLLDSNTNNNNTNTNNNNNNNNNTQKESSSQAPAHATIGNPCDWAAGVCRPPVNADVDAALVFEYLHQQPDFYVSCGAKFGSDFLIYDGPRDERHAFAGMRVLVANIKNNNKNSGTTPSTSKSLPLPTAYSLAGYVRCLNTAGKLAILATIVRDTIVTDDVDDPNNGKTLYRIAFVDVALEKILSAPTHKKRFRTNKRRDVTKNLAKT
jgi:tRNA splicing endonuclease